MSKRLQVRLLGSFEACFEGGEKLALKGKKTQALLAMLAMTPGNGIPRERLAGLLWSDRGDEQARGSLRQSLAELRRALGEDYENYLKAKRDSVALDARWTDCDVVTLERMANGQVPVDNGEIASLYRGDLLDGIEVPDAGFEEWLAGERSRLGALAQIAMNRLLDDQAKSGDTEGAIVTAQKLLEIDSLQEQVHRMLMRLYATRGDRALALKQFQYCCEVLKAELDVEPEPETRQLHDDIRRGTEAPLGTSDGAVPRTIPARLAAADKPTIAVLPFVNESGDMEQGYFSEGIADDIIAELSRFRSLIVIARDSSFLYDAGDVALEQATREMNAQYIVRGSVRRLGDRVRIAAQLLETESGVHLWSDRYDHPQRNIFAVTDEIVGTIASKLVGGLEDHRRRRIHHTEKDRLVAYDYVLQGDHLTARAGQADILASRDLYRKALELDPENARAHAGFALGYLLELWSDWSSEKDEAGRKGLTHARNAVSLDEYDSRARMALGAAYHFAEADFTRAGLCYDKALELNPNDFWGWCLKSLLLALSGEGDQALFCSAEAIRRGPLSTYDCRISQFLSNFTARRYEDALKELYSIAEPENEVNACLAMCYAQLGRQDDARQAAAIYMETARQQFAEYPGDHPDAWRRYWRQRYPFKREEDFVHLVDSFCKAAFEVNKA